MPTSSSSSPPTRPAPRIVSATVSAYALVLVLCPRDLRAAYGAQMAQVFRQCCRAAYARGGAWGVARLWLPTLADLLAGAAAEYRALLAQWWMGGSPAHRTRASTITVFRAYSAFVIAGCSFAKIPEHDGVAEATRAHPVIGLAFALTAAGSLVALLAVVAGGLPLAVAALRSARAERRRDIPLLFAVPPLALAAFVGVTVLLERLTHDPSRVAILLFAGAFVLAVLASAAAVSAAIAFAGAFVLAVLASAAAVSAAIARGQVGGRLLSYARASAALVALAMSAMLASTVIWGLTLRAAAPRLFDGMDAYGVFTWTRVVALMALATLAALVGVGRGFAPRRGTRMRV